VKPNKDRFILLFLKLKKCM